MVVGSGSLSGDEVCLIGRKFRKFNWYKRCMERSLY